MTLSGSAGLQTGRVAALQAEAARLEEETKKEAERETNPESANPVGASKEAEENEEEEEEESTDSSETSSEEETKPESANPVGPNLENVAPEEEGVTETDREQAAADLNDECQEAVRPYAQLFFPSQPAHTLLAPVRRALHQLQADSQQLAALQH